MNDRFEAIIDPAKEQIDALTRITPFTPFNTFQYAEAWAIAGHKHCILVQWSEEKIAAGSLAVLQGGFLSHFLEIMTAPNLPNPDIFWNGVRDFCKKQGIDELIVNTFASEPTAAIPSMPGELERKHRYENILDLTSSDFLKNLSSNHRYNIKRATNAKVLIRKANDSSACKIHLKLMQLSTARRIARGESISVPEGPEFLDALIASGAGELYQAYLDEKVLSSIIIIRSALSAYGHSAGNSPEGMNLGSSAFLFSEIAKILKSEGLRSFNLGGSDPEALGLRRFKAGFGGHEIMLEAAKFSMISSAKRSLRKVVRHLRHGPQELLKSLKAANIKVEL